MPVCAPAWLQSTPAVLPVAARLAPHGRQELIVPRQLLLEHWLLPLCRKGNHLCFQMARA